MNIKIEDYFQDGIKDPELIPFGIIMFGIELHKASILTDQRSSNILNQATVSEINTILGDCACSSYKKALQKESRNMTIAAPPDALHCLMDSLLDFVGVHYLTDLASSYAAGQITSTVLAQTVKGLLKKAGIGIGVAWAAYDFGDCMNWW